MQMLLSALQRRPQLQSEAELEEEARRLSATARSEAMKGIHLNPGQKSITDNASVCTLVQDPWRSRIKLT